MPAAFTVPDIVLKSSPAAAFTVTATDGIVSDVGYFESLLEVTV